MTHTMMTCCAVVAIAVVAAGCGADDDESVGDLVLACIDGGGTVDETAEVAIENGRAIAVVGPVDASEAVIADCLDRANP